MTPKPLLFICILCMVSCCSFSQVKKAFTLIIGLSTINEKDYLKKYNKEYDRNGLAGVSSDCRVMEKIAKENNHQLTVLRDTDATRKNILHTIDEIGKKVQQEGDNAVFTLYFSGHGDTIPDHSNDEASKFDQVLVAYDDFVVDDEINVLLRKYFTKSENIMFIDACHSGSSYKIFMAVDFLKGINKLNLFANEKKAIAQKADYSTCDYSQMQVIKEPYNLIYFGATPDDKSAGGLPFGSSFTYWLNKVIRDAQYTGDWKNMTYRKLACKLAMKLSAYHQNMIYREIGEHVNLYNNNLPFKIN